MGEEEEEEDYEDQQSEVDEGQQPEEDEDGQSGKDENKGKREDIASNDVGDRKKRKKTKKKINTSGKGSQVNDGEKTNRLDGEEEGFELSEDDTSIQGSEIKSQIKTKKKNQI